MGSLPGVQLPHNLLRQQETNLFSLSSTIPNPQVKAYL